MAGGKRKEKKSTNSSKNMAQKTRVYYLRQRVTPVASANCGLLIKEIRQTSRAIITGKQRRLSVQINLDRFAPMIEFSPQQLSVL